MSAVIPPPASYALSLPRTLYGDDINGNNNMMMTQSMDPAHLAARLDNGATPSVVARRSELLLQPEELMTASLDPSMLCQIQDQKVRFLKNSEIFFWEKMSECF
jgi:hypothetical protein